ncbi:MAG: MBL fold metallo-hydrolase [Clostridia bacterium]|nr:MBL fold metallo-hydrolase [Clostridia bacterium]
MKITFLGATRTVTGSNFLIETNDKKFLVDCGLYQGQDKEILLNSEDFMFTPSDIDFMLLTHAHIDHSGRIPKLYKDGYRGPIYATKATVDLCSIMLPDSGYIQESEVDWLNRKRMREGKHPVDALYTAQDAIDSQVLFEPVEYDEEIQLTPFIRVRFNEAGHMLGSAIIEVWVTEDGEEQKIVFSGDLGNDHIPLLRHPSRIEEADILVMETTYGDRDHINKDDKAGEFLQIVSKTLEQGGNVVIPSFAVGRTQEILYELQKSKQSEDPEFRREFDEVMEAPVYVDSPLATSATEVFLRNLNVLDEEVQQDIKDGKKPLDFPDLRFTTSVEESRALNEHANQSIIISASGMCEVGRIKHHLKHNLWRHDSTILFVGYQAVGTLGRKIVDGAKMVKIFGEEISVNANIKYIESFSGHADRSDLLAFVDNFRTKPKQVFLVHGEEEAQLSFSDLLYDMFKLKVEIPYRGDVYELTPNRYSKVGEIKSNNEYKYARLELLERLSTLREEIEDMSIMINDDLKRENSDKKVSELTEKIKELEKQIVEIIDKQDDNN